MKNQLTPEEVLVTQLGLAGMIEDMESAIKTSSLNVGAKKQMDTLLANAKSAHEKIASASGKAVLLEPFKEGDEKEFLLKKD